MTRSGPPVRISFDARTAFVRATRLTRARRAAKMNPEVTAMDQAVKCACERCFCTIQPGKGVVRDGKLYCSETCAYDCTSTTCLCVHDRCDEKH
jgi:hypothetical protein